MTGHGTLALVALGLASLAHGRPSGSSGVEWWGDRRAWMVPEGAQGFRIYDLSYDDDLCASPGSSGELRAHAVEGFAYFGQLLTAKAAATATDCQRLCYEHDTCRAVNFYRPRSYHSTGYCELLADTQWDSPRWMRRYTNAVYYDSIMCHQVNDEAQADGGNGGAWAAQPTHHPNELKAASDQLFVNDIFSKIRDFVHKKRLRR